MRALLGAVQAGDIEGAKRALPACMTSPRHTLPFRKLRAKLEEEIGPGSDVAAPTIIFNIETNLDPAKLRRRTV